MQKSRYWTPSSQQGWAARIVTESFSVLSRVLPAVYGCFVGYNFWNHFLRTGRWTSLLWMIAEGQIILLLVVRRGSRRLSKSPWDWLVAFVGTFAELFVRPATAALVPDFVSVTLQIAGILFAFWGKTVLGKSFGVVAADRGIVAGGPYRLIRHPIYLGYFISSVGFLLSNVSLRNLLFEIVTYVFQVLRILSEERILSVDPAYREYRGRVHFRLIPGVY
jgi:protein-S-isoprenylcysteine O-methyltransferase Ste14